MENLQENRRMRKVLNIVPYPYLPFFSGGQKLIAYFNEFLGKECELHVAGTANNNIRQVKNYTFHPLLNPNRLRYINPILIFSLGKLIRNKQIDTVILEHPYYGWLGWILKKRFPVRLIVHTHNIEYERFRSIGKAWWKLLRIYETWVLRQADEILCISEEDRKWMIEKMQIEKNRCILVPYGIPYRTPPEDKIKCKELICQNHGLDRNLPLLFFNGLLDYKPNLEALDVILNEMLPRLREQELPYNILIAGKRLPETYKDLKAWNKQQVFYAGFVDDIDLYTKAADILLNPVISGGGVKTKMIEALGANTSVVATQSGSAGVDVSVCGGKLKIVPDYDWFLFTQTVIETIKEQKTDIPDAFYKKHYWGEVVRIVFNKD